jgi:hypothetical protein
MWSVLLRSITPTQVIAINEDNAAQNAAIICSWNTMALREIGLKPHHLTFCQPVKIANYIPYLGTVNHPGAAAARNLIGPEAKRHLTHVHS